MGQTLTRPDEWTAPSHQAFSASKASAYLSFNESLIRLYAAAARRHARTEDLGDDGWFAEVVGLEGVYGQGETRDEAEAELEVAIVAWVEIKLQHGQPVPPMDGIEF